jgi:hypothetical protein
MNLIAIRIIALIVLVVVASYCLGAVHKGGPIVRAILMAEAPARGRVEGGL